MHLHQIRYKQCIKGMLDKTNENIHIFRGRPGGFGCSKLVFKVGIQAKRRPKIQRWALDVALVGSKRSNTNDTLKNICFASWQSLFGFMASLRFYEILMSSNRVAPNLFKERNNIFASLLEIEWSRGPIEFKDAISKCRDIIYEDEMVERPDDLLISIMGIIVLMKHLHIDSTSSGAGVGWMSGVGCGEVSVVGRGGVSHSSDLVLLE